MLRSLTALALLATLAGCDIAGDQLETSGGKERREASVDGTYVGRLEGTQALVAVSAAPAARGERRRQFVIFVCDGAEMCEWLTASAAGNRFSAASSDGDTRVQGSLTRRAATGSVEFASGDSVDYTARRATAAAGLYTLTVSSRGRLQGASAGGVGLTGRSTLPEPGRGRLKLADGTRLAFRAVRSADAEALRIKTKEARLIVLSNGSVAGAGSTYYLRSRR